MPQRLPTDPETPRFVSEMRLSGPHWIVVLLMVLLVILVTPGAWKRIERFDTGPDYRIPYRLSSDYWLYERWLERARPDQVAVVGDSVVWGEYVLPDGTLSHFLSASSGRPDAFVNAGVNGLFPLALEGLIRYYGGPLHGRRILLHCNVLWMSSPKADLQTPKEERFNHADLVPQFAPRIPCYKADFNTRLGRVLTRRIPFLAWVDHLQDTSFDQKSILNWTLADDGQEPQGFPNIYRNPLSQLELSVPGPPPVDPDRGPASERHQPWFKSHGGPASFDWVNLDTSLQWGAFRRLLEVLRHRHNDVLVVLGPFNEAMVAESSLPGFQRLQEAITGELRREGVRWVQPAPLPSALYADASHPLTDGYRVLAQRLISDPVFQDWLGRHPSKAR